MEIIEDRHGKTSLIITSKLPVSKWFEVIGEKTVAVPGLVAHILNGTGRVNVGQGAVMTVQGLGASLSPAIGGWIAQGIGYSQTFIMLGSFAIGSILLWIIFSKNIKEAY